MTAINYDQFLAIGKANFEALIKSGTLAAKGFEELAKVYAAFSAESIEKANAAVKALATVKSPVELIELQTKLVREGAQALATESRKIAEMTNTIVTASVEPLTARFQALSTMAKVA